jgi:hypothetical protein
MIYYARRQIRNGEFRSFPTFLVRDMENTGTVHWQRSIAHYMAACVFLLVAATANADEKISPAAIEFVTKGAHTVLSQCDLPTRKCGNTRLKVKSADLGEVNGEKKSFETLAANGMETMVVFSVADRSSYSLNRVEITSPEWPNVNGINIGLDHDAVIQSLGAPNGGTKNSCDTYFDDGNRGEASVCYSDGKVSRIQWEYFDD